MIRRLRIWWVMKVLVPLHRRKLKKGTMVLLSLNERMNKVGWSRKRRRQAMREIFRNPEQLHFMLDLLYGENKLGRWPR